RRLAGGALRLGGVHGARVPRHVRHRLSRQPRPAPDPSLRGLRGPPAAQGLPEAARAAARALPRMSDAVDIAFPNPVRSIFDPPLRDDSVIVNIGPSHPATHGTV